MNPGELLAIWSSLRKEDLATGLVRRRLCPDAGCDIFACATTPEGEVGFLIEGPWHRGHALGMPPTCRGMRITGATAGDGQRAYLRVLLEKERLMETFSILATDLIEAVSLEPDMPSAATRCMERLTLWQGLIERVPEDGLSAEAQRGLFGELTILTELMIPALGKMEAVSSWAGPTGARHDFITKAIGVEVKTTISKAPVRLRISNELQLDDTGLDALFVAHVRLLPMTSRRMTLPSLIEELRKRLDDTPTALAAFEQRLVLAGYLDTDRERYGSVGYVVSGMDYYRVEDEFPRLIKGNLPLGVGDVTYSIPVDMLGAYCATSETIKKMLGD